MGHGRTDCNTLVRNKNQRVANHFVVCSVRWRLLVCWMRSGIGIENSPSSKRRNQPKFPCHFIEKRTNETATQAAHSLHIIPVCGTYIFNQISRSECVEFCVRLALASSTKLQYLRYAASSTLAIIHINGKSQRRQRSRSSFRLLFFSFFLLVDMCFYLPQYSFDMRTLEIVSRSSHSLQQLPLSSRIEQIARMILPESNVRIHLKSKVLKKIPTSKTNHRAMLSIIFFKF